MNRLPAIFLILCLMLPLACCSGSDQPDRDDTVNAGETGTRSPETEIFAPDGTESGTASSEARTATGETSVTEDPAVLPDPTPGNAEFVGELFGEDPDENFYNYCPTVMTEGNGTMHIWYCSNRDPGDVTDFIAYRRGTLHADGKWTFTEKQLVLGPGSDSAWDSRHVCDPSVVKGTFRYDGEDYSYLMAYLGCRSDNSTANEVGLAFAKSPEGPWVRYGANPIADFISSEEYNAANWGYGQPSLVSMDRGGKVFLFYTKGVATGTFTQVELWDLTDADHPVRERGAAMPNTGIALNNADFAYDPAGNCFYCVKEDHTAQEWYPTDGGVNWISGSVSLLRIRRNGSPDIRDGIFGGVTYTVLGTIDPAATGYPRNHNAGLVTDEYGWIRDSGDIAAVYSVSGLATDHPGWTLGGQWPALHTYRLHGYRFFG